MNGAPEHVVKSFDQELKTLKALLTDMGGIVESQLSLAARAVLQHDAAAAAAAVESDPRVDNLERQAEELVIRMLALRQPMADDLRHIVGALKIASDLERIGDYATNAAKRSLTLSQFNLPFSMSGLSHLIQLVQRNLTMIVDAIGEDDVTKAMQVWSSDRPIDEAYNTIFRELITYMMEDPRSITPCTHLLFIAKNLERIGDHATNIAENLHYAVSGEVLAGARPKSDGAPYVVVREKE